MYKFLPIFLLFFFVSCQRVPKVNLSWPDSKYQEQIVNLNAQIDKLNAEFDAKINAKTNEINSSKNARVSNGGANAIAALLTLLGDPLPTKFVLAAIEGLNITKESLVDLIKPEDLLRAIDNQSKLISEQANLIAQANTDLAAQKEKVVNAKTEETRLNAEIEKIKKQHNEEISMYSASIDEFQKQLDSERLEWAGERDKLATKYQADNVWWKKYNPFYQLGQFASSLFWWIAIVVILGVILKICSVIFPGVNIFTYLIHSIGKLIGGAIGIFTRWIPGFIKGMKVVDEKTYNTEKQIANNTIGAIGEARNFEPELFEKLKPYLKDWNKDSPELKEIIDAKLKELNLV